MDKGAGFLSRNPIIEYALVVVVIFEGVLGKFSMGNC